MTLKQVARKLENTFEKWDFKKAIEHSNNETNTRDYLIEPFFDALGYSAIDDYVHEYSLRYEGSVKSVDMAITLSGKNPEILVECKKANINLTKSHYNQLSSYYEKHKESKIGILTNGIIYRFYSRSLENATVLNVNPFFEFNLNNFNFTDLEKLSLFYRTEISIKNIIEEAEDFYFLENFESALFKTLNNKSKPFRKLIHENMGGGRMSDKISERIYNHINYYAYEQAVEKIRLSEARSKGKGIITTLEEKKCFAMIKTILATSSKISSQDLKRISYRDYKGHFKIMIDNMPSKEICSLVIKDYIKTLYINGQEYEEYTLNSLSNKEMVKYRKKLTDAALSILAK